MHHLRKRLIARLLAHHLPSDNVSPGPGIFVTVVRDTLRLSMRRFGLLGTVVLIGCGGEQARIIDPDDTVTLLLTPGVVSFSAVEGTDPAPQNVVVAEPGGGDLGAISVQGITFGAGQPSGWLTATLAGTTAPTSLTLRAESGALIPGTYHATVNVASALAKNSPQPLPVSFVVASQGSALISMPTNSVAFLAETGTTSPTPQTVAVTNGGAGTLILGLGAITYEANQPVGWLAASLDGTVAPATLTLTPTLGSLPPGNYIAFVPVTSSNAANSPQHLAVGFVVTSSSTPPPTPPAINANCGPYPTPSLPAPLRTWYVDGTNGNDSNNGTSLATAWKTLGKANGSVQPGDLVLVRGVFSGQAIRPAVSGTAANKIIYRVIPGDSARITIGTFDVAVWLDSREHIVVDGFEVHGVSNSVLMRFNSNHNWIQNLNIHDAGGIIISNGDDNRIEGTTITRVGSESANAGDAIFIQDGSDRNIVVRNTVSYAGHGTIWISFQSASEAPANDNVIAHNNTFNPWASGMGLNGKAVRTIVECNRMHLSADGTGVNYARGGLEIEGQDNIIRYNEIFRNGAFGITIQGRTFGGFLQNASGNHVYGNTFWRNGNASIQFVQRDAGTVRNNIIENNIFWNDAGLLDQGTRYGVLLDMFNANSDNILPPGDFGGNIVRYSVLPPGQRVLMIRKAGDGGNTVYSIADAMTSLAGWTNLLTVDPLFTNEAANDVRLLDSSPAIDIGRQVSGQSFLGGGPDLGAREKR